MTLLDSTTLPPSTDWSGERRRATVMFADISGFTAMSERLDPEAVRNLVNDCFERLSHPIDKYEGHIAKFIGDSIMALFGAPVAHENDAERAVRAALEMQEALRQFNAEHEQRTGVQLALHFGINTGLVIAGAIGASRRQQYDVIGDTVNLAARLEDLSETGQILVGPDTYQSTLALFEYRPLLPVRLKGKAEPVTVYEVTGLKVLPGRTRGIEGLSSPLVGRDGEFKRLLTAVLDLQNGNGGVAAVIGEAGLGKSRLLAEVRAASAARLDERGDRAVWAEGRGLSYGGGMSYLVARDLLHGLLGLPREVEPDQVVAALHTEIERFLPSQQTDVYPFLAHLLELPLDEPAAGLMAQLDGETLQRRMRQATQAYIQARAEERPLVLVWEDLHWSDSSSLGLLDALVPLSLKAPLLLITLYRPLPESRLWEFHERTALACGDCYMLLELHPLTGEESVRLVQNLLDIEGLPPAMSRLIQEKAEGNPFYVEEVIRSLIDGGAIVREGGYWRVTEQVANVRIPDTLQDLIMARIDRLPPETKLTLQMASVIGRTFLYRVLAHLAEQEQL
jgi:class 3 adenylate cyclase